MTKQGLASAIGLATVDKTFRDGLLNDPTTAIHESNFDLDSSEIEFLKKEETRAIIREYSERMNTPYKQQGRIKSQ